MRLNKERRHEKALLLSVIIILLCGGFVIFDDLIDFNPPDRAWNCSYSHGVKFCEGRIGGSQTTYTVTLDVPAGSEYKAIANIYIDGNVSLSTGWLYAGQSKQLEQAITYGQHNWSSGWDVQPVN